jgi:hypothetical protein
LFTEDSHDSDEFKDFSHPLMNGFLSWEADRKVTQLGYDFVANMNTGKVSIMTVYIDTFISEFREFIMTLC